MNIRHGSSHPMQSRLAGLARTWRQTLAGLAIVGAMGITMVAAAATADPAATLVRVHADTGALSVDQGRELRLQVVKQIDGHGLAGQPVTWTVAGPGKAELSATRSLTATATKDTQAGSASTVFHASVPGDYTITATTQKNPGCGTPGCATWVSTRFAVSVAATGSEAAGGAVEDHHGAVLAATAAALVGGLAIAAGTSHGSDHNVAPLSRDLVLVSGDGQAAGANAALAVPLRVRAISGGSPSAGVVVQWSATGGAVLSGSSSTTDGGGVASINVTSIGPGPAPVTITATRSDYPNAKVTFSASVLQPALNMVSGDGQSAFPGHAIAQPLVVQALLGPNPQSGVPISWVVTSGDATVSAVSNGGLTNPSGTSSARIQLGPSAGPVVVTATRTDVGLSQSFNLSSAVSNALTIATGNGQLACPNLPLPQNLVVRALTNNRPVAGVTVNWSASGTVVLNNASSITDGNGFARAHVTNIGPDYQPGASYVSVLASRSDDPTATATFTASVAASTMTVSSGNGQSGAIGSTSSPMVVALVDGCGHAIVNQPVAWTVISGSATVSASTTQTNGSGQAQVTVTYGSVPGNVVIQASALGGGLISNFNATATTGGVNIGIGNNQTGNPGTILPQPLTVHVVPAIAGVPVSFTVISGSATVLTPSTFTDGAGMASTQLQLGLTPGPVQVLAQAGNSTATFSATVAGTIVGSSLTIVSGNNQIVAPNTASQPMVVQLQSGGSPLSAMTIQWSASGGALSASSTTTGANGQTSVTLTPSGSGPVTVTATFLPYAQYTGAQVSFAQNTTLASVSGQSTNDESIAHALDSACAVLINTSNRTPQQQDMLNQCLALGEASSQSPGAVASAINQMAPAVAETQSATATTAVTTQFNNLAGRMQALRGGAQGVSFAGLAFNNDTGSLPIGDLGAAMLSANDQKNDASSSFSRWGFFGSGQIQRQNGSAQAATPGYRFGSNGLTFGADYRVSDSFVLGGALGYTHQSTTLDLAQGDMSMRGWSLSAYATWYDKSDWYVDSSITWSNNSFDASRHIAYALPVPGGVTIVDQIARSSSGGNDFAGSVTFGRDFHFQAVAYGLYGKLQYDHSSFDGFSEYLTAGLPGSGLGLRVNARSTTSIASVLGAKVDYNASMKWGVMVPHAEVEWQHEFRTDPNTFIAYFIDDPTNTPILIRGDKTDSDFFRFGAGMSFVFPQGRSAFLLYNRTVGRQGISAYNLSLGFRLEF